MTKSRVVLADDHKMFLEGLRRLLQPEFDVVGVVGDGRSLVSTVAELQPDVAVADISMPDLNGIDAAREILQAGGPTKVVLLTMHEEPGYAMAALDAGVSG